MRYGSVCSGVEAATLAWAPLGWECKFVAEVEPFPCAVLQERFGATAPIRPLDPADVVITAEEQKEIAELQKRCGKKWKKACENADLLSRLEERKMRMAWKKQNETLKTQGVIPNEGDFTKIGKKYAGKIDLLVGGTPCQDLSVAGKRAGFNGERSSLALDFVRLAYESQCKWFVWENVPGVFSSNNGRDFATLLSLFTGCEVGVPRDGWSTAGFVCNARRDRYGVAWRVLDGQFTRTQRFPFAVPQRRRRVFVVGCFGDWVRAAQVLLEPDRLSWNTPARIKTRERAAEITGKDSAMAEPTLQCTEKGCTDRHWDVSGVNPTLNQCSAGSSIIGASNQELFAQNFNGLVSTFWNGNDYAEALTCSSDRQLIPDKARLQCVIECNEVASTLTAAMADKLGLENQHVDQGCPNFIIKSFTGGESESGEVVPTLQANLGKMLSNQTPIICRATQQGNAETMVDACPTITEAAGTSGNNQPIICLNDQGGSVMQIEANGSAGTLRANTHGNEQIVCGAFSGNMGAKAGNIGHSEEVAPTQRSGAEIDIVQTLKIRGGKDGGGKGALVQDNISATQSCGNDQTLFVIHGAQTPISNTEHANPLGCCNDGLENCICQSATDVISCNSKKMGLDIGDELCGTLNATDYKEPQVVCYKNHPNDSRVTEMGDCCQTISSRASTGGGNLPLIQACYAIDSTGSNSMKSANPHSGFHKEEVAKTLDTTAPHPIKNQGGNVICEAVAIAENIIGRKVENGGNGVRAQDELAYTQNASGVMGVCTTGIESIVRRLLPIECERLMGFPDNHTRIPWKGQPEEQCPDSPRYKASGNSICVNAMHWIGEQIDKVDKMEY